MSTNDVPGANPANRDELGIGSWAEHQDGSLIFVQGTENDTVVYSMFDLTKQPLIEWRDMMPIGDFEIMFSCSAKDIHKPVSDSKGRSIKKEQWTWHDKTAFPWDRVIKAGAMSGAKFASAADVMSAAERIAQNLHLRAKNVNLDEIKHRAETPRAGNLKQAFKDFLDQVFPD